jgi:hypothetical protein
VGTRTAIATSRAWRLREAEEESGLPGLSVEHAIFDLDRHWIPERGDVPGHWHYDVRYVVRAGVTRTTWSATNRTTWHGAGLRRSLAKPVPMLRCSGWRGSGFPRESGK